MVRIAATVVPETTLANSLAEVDENVIPSYERAPGLVWVGLLKRRFAASVEVVILSM
jgi:hypothetical protein